MTNVDVFVNIVGLGAVNGWEDMGNDNTGIEAKKAISMCCDGYL